MSSVWAVAKNTIAQALRMKIAVIIILMLGILLPLMGIVMVGDGTLKGKLQTFISYGLSLTSFLLCVMTIAISTHTLTDDIKCRQIFLVVTKPVRRFELLCGKVLGIVIFDIFLLAVFAGIIYGLTVAIPKISSVNEIETYRANDEFFTARATLEDPVDRAKIKERVDKIFADRQKSGDLPAEMPFSRTKMIKQTIMSEELGKIINVQAGGVRRWQFNNIRRLKEGETLFIQYKLKATSASVESIMGKWAVGDERHEKGNIKTNLFRFDRSDSIRTVHEFKVPASVVAEDGYVAVLFHNSYVNQTTVIPEEVKLLYRAGSFTANYLRVLVVILTRLVFLAVLGVSVSTWLSFPVAILICVVVFFAGTVNGFIVDSIDSLGKEMVIFYSFTIKPLLWMLPKFDRDFNPTPYMVSGEFLRWTVLARIFVITGIIKSGVLLLLGMLIFSKREIAKISA